MEERVIRIDRQEEIDFLEETLEVKFPRSYREFLLNREEIEKEAGFELPVFGLPSKGLPETRKKEKDTEEVSPKREKESSFPWLDMERLWKQTAELEEILKKSQEKEIKEKGKRELSFLEATQILRTNRPDLKDKPLVCVRLVGDWAVCLDLRERPEEDCPLIQVNRKDKEIPIIQTSPSFRGSIEKAIRDYQRALAAKQRVANRREEVEGARGREFSHVHKKGEPYPLQPGPRDWHPLIRRAHDDVVGRTAFRYNSRLGALEVDEFYAPDHPEYEEGDPLRNLACSIFSLARELGGSLNIVFSRDLREDESGRIVRTPEEAVRMVLRERYREIIDRNRYPRLPRPVPLALVELAKEHYGISFEKEKEGKISNREGVNLFFAFLEFPDEVRRKVEELEKAGYLSKEVIGEVISAGIWSREEAVWFFLNAPRPEAIILGTDVPESRLLYSESAHYGRAVYLAGLLKQKILVDLSGGLSEEERAGVDCQLEPKGEFWLLRADQRFPLPWQIKGAEPVWVEPEEPVLLLSRPKQTSQPEKDRAWLAEKIEFLAKAESEVKIRCLLLSFEFSDLKYGMKISEEMKEISREAAKKGVCLLFSPFKLDILSDEVEERMGRARRMRRFEPRSASLKLQIFEIPTKKAWQEPGGLRYSVEDALSAASWIVKKIDMRLGRIRFRTNCQVVERIAIQDSRNKKIAELDGKESEELLAVLKSEQGITFPFVQPENVPEFLAKTKGKAGELLQKVKGGIIAVVPPYEKSAVEPEVKPIERPVITLIPAGFQFPVDPENIDFSRYKQGHRKEEIRRFHEQIQEALRTGQPLAVSYLPHELFPEVMRDYIYYTAHIEYREKPFLFFFKRRVKQERREPPEPVMLRVSYHDGTEGEPFPLFCLSEPKKSPDATNFYELKMGSISMRHVNLDSLTEGYLMQNIMVKRKQTSADQEDYGFRRTGHFLANFVDLVQHKNVEEIFQLDKRFKFKWDWLKLEERKYEGLELHIFQTGLEPAVVGMYRAVVEFLRKKRGELVVTPRLISHREWRKLREEKGIQGISEDVYLRTAEWF